MLSSLVSFLSLRAAGQGLMKRAQRGLYGGKRIMFGNTISHSERRHRRSWKPNVQMIRLYSELLETNIRFRMTTFVLRQVDKMGGIDRYLLYTPNEKLDSELGVKLKLKLMDVFEKKHGAKFDYRNKSLILPLGTYVRPSSTTPGSHLPSTQSPPLTPPLSASSNLQSPK
eukprot:Phypoly_transcript_14425.p1 GENE.Phypoly_transcript_14425~~Phypoly_transcript_14425.p1  ORF type:complete len:170 (+),score=11.07 Phypoly_transcript_14425:235-744(+)